MMASAARFPVRPTPGSAGETSRRSPPMTSHPEKPPLGPKTQMCMSLAARPGSFGTRFHNRLYELLGLDFVYKAFTTADLQAAIGGVRALGIRGCAISMPFKEAVIPLLDRLEGSAAAIESV